MWERMCQMKHNLTIDANIFINNIINYQCPMLGDYLSTHSINIHWSLKGELSYLISLVEYLLWLTNQYEFGSFDY